MASVLSVGKYRPRKDWSTNSIPTLVSLEEENLTANHVVIENLTNNGIPPKPPRRSSLAIGLLNGRNANDHNNKRRSSIAVATFLGRRDNNKNRDVSFVDVPVINENCLTNDISIKINEANEDGTEDKRRRRLSLHEKFRRRKKGQITPTSGGGGVGGGNNGITTPPTIICDGFEIMQVNGNSNGGLNGGSAVTQFNGSRNNSLNGLNGDLDGHHIEYVRQKRPSWWNIFLPDKQSRSRRASQDVGIISRSNDSLAPAYPRSKSRSVDHGLAAPFDLDSLRSKVEGRFESVDRLSKDGSKSRSTISIPTTSYTVGNRDTLTSVAARFDTTPSELTSLNRLASSFIYPGQQLLVPDKDEQNKDESSRSGQSSPTEGGSTQRGKINSSDDLPQDEKELLDGLRPGSPKPGHIERVSSPNTRKDDDDPIITQRFLKINVRHITDGQGVVGGVLLVTPNAVMFDPNVSDPLVIEHGPESYGVIAPMELVVNAAIFHDIAHMRVGGSHSEQNQTEKPEVYYPKPTYNRYENTHSPGKDSLLVKDETFPELGVGSVEVGDDQESVCSSNEREGDAFPKAFERELVTPTNLQRTHDEQLSTESCGSAAGGASAGVYSTAANQNKNIILTKDLINTNSIDGSTITSTITTTQAPSTNLSINNKTDEDKKDSADGGAGILKDNKSLEERRKSLLDHHWAVPSKDSSLEDKDESETDVPAIASGLLAGISCAGGGGGGGGGGNIPQIVPQIDDDEISQLVKLSCHDSGIDIRDPNSIIPAVQPIPAKKVYSDAEIVLSNDWVPPLTIAPTHFSDSPPKQSTLGAQSTINAQNIETTGRKKTSSVSFSVDDNENNPTAGGVDKTNDTKKNKMLKRLSYPLAWVEGLTGETNKSLESQESAPSTGDSTQSVFSKVFSSSPITLVSELGGNLFLSKTPSEDSGGSPVPPLTPHEGQNTPGRSSIGTFIRPHSSEGTHPIQKPNKAPTPKLDYRSMVSIDDMPELFVSFDKLIPRPARACPDPPLYLRLRMGRPLGKAPPLPTSVMSYGKNKLRPEYWFSIPKNRVDELYRFLNSWVPHLYGELDDEQVMLRGFELIQHDTEWAQGEGSKDGRSNSDGEMTELTRESWELLKAPYVKIYNIIKSQTGSNDLEGCEVLSMSTDDYRKATLFATGSFDQDFPIPELIGTTEILTEEHREKLCSHLPARAEGYAWSLVFSTSQHGFSLNSLYRKMQKLETPVLIVIQDTDNNVFGALTSCPLHVSDHFYGTGESLLYKFNPHFKVFHWSGENLYFIKGNPESLAIGAGDGKFGLWLDGDLNQGRSQRCSTYSNEPLAPQEDFVIKTLECWAFV